MSIIRVYTVPLFATLFFSIAISENNPTAAQGLLPRTSNASGSAHIATPPSPRRFS
jgi:hypothetical protein